MMLFSYFTTDSFFDSIFCSNNVCKSGVYQLIKFHYSFAQSPEPDFPSKVRSHFDSGLLAHSGLEIKLEPMTAGEPSEGLPPREPPETEEEQSPPQPDLEPPEGFPLDENDDDERNSKDDERKSKDDEPETADVEGKNKDDESKSKDDEPETPDVERESADEQAKTRVNEGNSKCLIATAAFGSELTPEVLFLREFRDEKILSTVSGSSFMNVFNAWYYSFSPTVANYERGQPWLQDTIKIGIYPLLHILQLSEKSYSLLPGEYGSVAAGTTASILIGLVYFTPLVLGLKLVKTKRKMHFKIYAIMIIAVTAGLLMAILVDDKIALTIMTPLFVVILCAISSIVCAKVIVIIRNTLFVGMKMPHRLNGKT